jgi:hypothetical protein
LPWPPPKGNHAMIKTKIWHIQEGFNIQWRKNSLEILSLNREDNAILFHIDEIDDMIDALKRVQSSSRSLKLAEIETENLARWGKERTPTENLEAW